MTGMQLRARGHCGPRYCLSLPSGCPSFEPGKPLYAGHVDLRSLRVGGLL
jgi:hypothetical protein